MLNNYGHFLKAGVDLDVPIYIYNSIVVLHLYIRGDVYARQYWRLLGFLGPDSFFEHESGVALFVGLRLRVIPPSQ